MKFQAERGLAVEFFGPGPVLTVLTTPYPGVQFKTHNLIATNRVMAGKIHGTV